MIQKTNQFVAVDISDEACEQVEQRREEARERFWKAIEEIGERNADKDPDEVLRVVTEVVEEVRQERYEREQCAKRGRSHQYIRQWHDQPSRVISPSPPRLARRPVQAHPL